MTFGEKLKKLRQDKGLTRKAAAEQSGMSIATYSSYEDGRRVPTRNPENYEKLAALFGCGSEYLKDDSIETLESSSVEPDRPQRKRATGKTKAVSSEIRMELQYGEKSIDMDTLYARARELDTDITDLYVKPEENMVYYVAGDKSGSFDLF